MWVFNYNSVLQMLGHPFCVYIRKCDKIFAKQPMYILKHRAIVGFKKKTKSNV